MAKRVLLFVATNIAILVTVSIIMAVLSATGLVDTRRGLSQGALMVYCLVWGMGASLVSLALSRKIAKWSMGVKLVDGQTGNPDLDWFYNTVGHLSRQANLPMPEVGFYESPEVNAFATGPSKSRSLVAVSTGLLQKMGQERGRGGPRPRDLPRRERRHGDHDPHPGRRERLRAVPLAHRGRHRALACSAAATDRGPSWPSSPGTSSSSPPRSRSACSAR